MVLPLYPFKGTMLNAPETWELEQKIHTLVTDGKPEEALALFKSTDIHKTLTPDVISQMQAAVKAEEDAKKLG